MAVFRLAVSADDRHSQEQKVIHKTRQTVFDHISKYGNGELKKKGRSGVFLTSLEVLENYVKDFLKPFDISSLIKSKT